MVSNILKTKTKIVDYTYLAFESLAGLDYADWFRQQAKHKQIKMRDIYSDAYIKSIKKYGRSIQDEIDHWSDIAQSRYLPPDKLNINLQMDIYDHTVAIYNWHKSEIFGIEITNPKLATFQKQIFELIWTQTKPPKKP